MRQMTPLPMPITATRASSGTPVSAAERAMLDAFDAQRRLSLLRLIVPGLLVVVIIALPFAAQADMQSQSYQSTLQAGVGLVAFALALWAMRARRVNLAAYALFGGVTGVIALLLLYDGPLGGA
nr:hypothetical protein [Ktedonobacterales bacterium]